MQFRELQKCNEIKVKVPMIEIRPGQLNDVPKCFNLN